MKKIEVLINKDCSRVDILVDNKLYTFIEKLTKFGRTFKPKSLFYGKPLKKDSFKITEIVDNSGRINDNIPSLLVYGLNRLGMVETPYIRESKDMWKFNNTICAEIFKNIICLENKNNTESLAWN